MRVTLTLVLLAVCFAAPGTLAQRAGLPPSPPPAQSAKPAPPAPAKPSTEFFDQLFDAYQKGDRDVLENTVVEGDQIIKFHFALDTVLNNKPNPQDPQHPWTKAYSAFLLESAIFASQHIPQDVVPALSAGRLYVMGRPHGFTLDPAEDAFEVMWHRIAIAVLQRITAADGEDLYLDTLERRYLTSSAAIAAKTTLDPHFVLDRVIATEQTVWKLEFATPGERSTRLTALRPTDSSKAVKRLKEASSQCDEAVALEVVAIEANIRCATIAVRLSQFDNALKALRRIDLGKADPVQQYWAPLIEGRALHELKRLPEAERAYRTAMAAWPDAPSPKIAVAMVLFEQNKREEAQAASAHALAGNPTGSDPWWSYLVGDARFINRWRDELRSMLR